MPQFDLNFEFGGDRSRSLFKKKTTSQQRRRQGLLLLKLERELSEVLEKMLKQKNLVCEEMEAYVVETSHHNGMVSQMFPSNKILVSFRGDCHNF